MLNGTQGIVAQATTQFSALKVPTPVTVSNSNDDDIAAAATAGKLRQQPESASTNSFVTDPHAVSPKSPTSENSTPKLRLFVASNNASFFGDSAKSTPENLERKATSSCGLGKSAV